MIKHYTGFIDKVKKLKITKIGNNYFEGLVTRKGLWSYRFRCEKDKIIVRTGDKTKVKLSVNDYATDQAKEKAKLFILIIYEMLKYRRYGD